VTFLIKSEEQNESFTIWFRLLGYQIYMVWFGSDLRFGILLTVKDYSLLGRKKSKTGLDFAFSHQFFFPSFWYLVVHTGDPNSKSSHDIQQVRGSSTVG